MRFILFILLLVSSLTVSAATFIVTSNADSGPGTLRQALTDAAANGSAEKDYINFNLPDLSEAGRTITLVSRLPDVSSNLVIDGTTQTGATFRLTDARIKIMTPFNNNAFTVFNGTGQNNIGFYGLYIFDYSDILLSRPDLKSRIGFNLIQCSNIEIGAAHKGNRITGFNLYSIYLESSDNIEIKNNIVGISDSSFFDTNNGNGGFSSGYTGTINLIKCNNIMLGGNSDEGNIIFTIVNFSFYQLTTSKVSIKSNNFLVYPDGISTEWYFEYYLGAVSFSTIFSTDTKNTEESLTKEAIVDIDFSNNITGCQLGIFRFDFIAGSINFTHNFFNLARDGVTKVTYNNLQMPPQLPVSVNYCNAQFNFGSNDVSKKNFFDNVTAAVTGGSTPNIFLRYNDFRCVADSAYGNYHTSYAAGPPYVLPTVSITGVNTQSGQTTINGKATPNSLVDIYSSESCQGACSIRSYIKTVNADATGNWQTTVNSLTGIFYASATLNNQTSLFKTFEVNTDNINIQHLRCDSRASITGLVVPAGVDYYWTDHDGNKISTELDLTVNKPGQYRLVIGGGCITSAWFEVLDERVIVFDDFLKKTNISCGKNDGSITGLFVYDPLNKISTKTWINEAGITVGNTTDIAGLPAGDYTLQIKTADGCSTSYGPIKLVNTSGPNIDQSSASITPTPCGQSKGSITNINVTGTGVLKYSWRNEQNQEVATTKDLINKPSGKYTLQITDEGNCGPVSSSPIEIPEVNGITLDESNINPTAATCNNNGAITGIVTGNAISLTWKDASNNTVGTSANLQNVPAGDYYLIATNATCSKQSKTYHIAQQNITIPEYPFSITPSCFDTNTGAISINTDGLVKAYRWMNSNNDNVGSQANLTNVFPGQYSLYLTNQNGCENFYKTYTVTQLTVTPPSVTDVQLCNSGSAYISVNNPSSGVKYRLYGNDGDLLPLDEQNGGKFKINISTGRSYFISQFNGTCESQRSEIKVSIGISAVNIANAITPNGDGINDNWIIKGIENYPAAKVQVFNRYGQQVFESKGYSTPFNGTMNGSLLPTGTYYYIINLNSGCDLLSGSLTIIR